MPFFAAFMIFIILWYEGDGEASFVPSVFMGACWNWPSPCPVGGWRFILLEMKWIRYYLKAPYPEKRRRKKKRNVRMKFLQSYVSLKMFLSSSVKDLDISHSLCSTVSVTVRATRALANMVVVFLALSWGGGALDSYVQPPYPCMRETWCSSQK